MTNGEKYKTADERLLAFNTFCVNIKEYCYDCPVGDPLMGRCGCTFRWLELEANDDEESHDEEQR